MSDEVTWPARPSPIISLYRTPYAITGVIASVFFLGSAAFVINALLTPLLLMDMAYVGLSTFYLFVALVLGLIGYPFARITRKGRQRHYEQVQAERNAFAEEVVSLLQAGKPAPPFSLYLRPFFTDGHLIADDGVSRAMPFDVADIADFGQARDLERAFAQAMEGDAPAIALGDITNRLTAGRIQTANENWEAIFELLIANAARVLMVPIGQPATLDEIGRIATTPGLLKKTVFVRPANRIRRSFNFTPDAATKSLAGMWRWTRENLRDVLPGFPQFGHSGRLFAFAGDGERVEYRGDGVSGVQHASSLRPFLTACRTRVADLAVVGCLAGAVLLVAVGNVYLDLADSVASLSGEVSATTSVMDVAAVRFFYQLITLAVIPLGLYKLVTGDFPFRAWAVFAGILASFVASSLLVSLAPEGNALLGSHLPVLLVHFQHLLLFYAFAALLTNNALVWWHFIVLVAVAALTLVLANLLPPPVVADQDAIDTPYAVILLLPYALAGSLPLWARAGSRERMLLVGAALVFAGLSVIALKFSLDAMLAWQIAFYDVYFETYDVNEKYALEMSGYRWRTAYALAELLPMLTFPFFARWLTGQGTTRSWAEPLEPYPE